MKHWQMLVDAILEEDREIRVFMDTAAGGNLAVLELYPTALRFVLELELRNCITLFQAFRELGIYSRARSHCLRNAPKYDR